MRIRLLHLVALSLAAATLPLSAATLIVEFREVAAAAGATSPHDRLRSDLRAASAKGGADVPSVAHEFRHTLHGAAVERADDAVVERLRALPYVAAVHRAVAVEELSAVSAPRRPIRPAGTAGGAGVVVAVIDSGIDYQHAAFGGGFGPGRKVAGGWDFINNDADPMDDRGHGTHVAGIIAGDGGGVSGLAPLVTLLAYKALDEHGQGNSAITIAAIERALDPNADGNTSDHVDIINLSLGGTGGANDPLARAVDAAVDAGVIVVAAAGNSGEYYDIGSPAAARKAITVGASLQSGELAEFSSKGPSVGAIGIKPEVTAPGVAISSAALGGGTVARSGTSMAAPYVAALAALILESHPGWNPERVKSAMVSTARAFPDGEVIAEGAGSVQKDRALTSDLSAFPPVLNFAVVSPAELPWSTTQTIRVTNESAASRQISITSPAVAGVAFSFDPQSFELSPGATRDVRVQVSVASALADPGPSLSYAGALTVQAGAAKYSIPWSFVHAARVTIETDFHLPLVAWNGTAEGRSAARFAGASVVETLLPPGTYDVAVIGDTSQAAVLIVDEQRVVTGDHRFSRTTADAPHTINLDATDITGSPLNRAGMYESTFRLVIEEARRSLEVGRMPVRLIRSSSFSNRFTLLAIEQVVDTANERVYVAQHPPLRALSGDRLLSILPSDYDRRDVVLDLPANSDAGVSIAARWITRRATEVSMQPLLVDIPVERSSEWHATVFMTPESHSDYAGAAQFSVWRRSGPTRGSLVVATSPLRRDAQGFFTTMLAGRPALPLAVDAGEAARFGEGISHPFFTIEGSGDPLVIHADFLGRRREMRTAERDGMTMRGTGPDGSALQGSMKDGFGTVMLPSAGSHSLTFDVANARVGDGSGRGTAELHFDTTRNDSVPPNFTSLAVVDSSGRNASRVRALTAARLVFSAGDFDFASRYPDLRDLDLSRTRAWYRRTGSEVWMPLSLHVAGEDRGTGEQSTIPAPGWIYEAALSDALMVASPLDIKLEIADLAGNTNTWTIQRAILVDPSASPVRRRAAR